MTAPLLTFWDVHNSQQRKKISPVGITGHDDVPGHPLCGEREVDQCENVHVFLDNCQWSGQLDRDLKKKGLEYYRQITLIKGTRCIYRSEYNV